MVCEIGMGYGVWESLVHLAGNRLGGHEKVWVMGGYGLLEVWVKTEATVVRAFFPVNSAWNQYVRHPSKYQATALCPRSSEIDAARRGYAE
jgi:hypothetical protein